MTLAEILAALEPLAIEELQQLATAVAALIAQKQSPTAQQVAVSGEVIAIEAAAEAALDAKFPADKP